MSLFLSSCTTQFGALPEGEYLNELQKSPNYKDGEFKNIEETPMMTGDKGKFEAMWDFVFADYPDLYPTSALPHVKTDLKALNLNDDLLIWFGHSSSLLQINGKRILIDPVIKEYAAPFSFLNKAFLGTTLYTVEDLPDIDYLVISHDHWDHLEFSTVTYLKDKIKKVICPLGIRSHLEYWGFASDSILEGDWNSHIKADADLDIDIVPARHFSGRFLSSNKTLWAGFVFTTPTHRIFYSGDSGYGKHFKEIGNSFPGIELALLENGQYNKDWKYIHMFPEEVAQAASDLKAQNIIPMHSGRFALSTHTWADPYIRLDKASQGRDFKLLTPMIGEIVYLDKRQQNFGKWWEQALAASKEAQN